MTVRPLAMTQVTALQWLERGALVWRAGAWRPLANTAVRLHRGGVDRLVTLGFARVERQPGGRRIEITEAGAVVAAAYARRRTA